eukprot:Filipodium_phascolosomae@DN132_c0_g1_i1.p1
MDSVMNKQVHKLVERITLLWRAWSVGVRTAVGVGSIQPLLLLVVASTTATTAVGVGSIQPLLLLVVDDTSCLVVACNLPKYCRFHFSPTPLLNSPITFQYRFEELNSIIQLRSHRFH